LPEFLCPSLSHVPIPHEAPLGFRFPFYRAVDEINRFFFNKNQQQKQNNSKRNNDNTLASTCRL
jgi:hypothetical protein